MSQLSQAADIKQAINLLHAASQLLYKTDCRLSDYNAIQTVLASLESDLTELLTHGQL
jgi:hypothetical protein